MKRFYLLLLVIFCKWQVPNIANGQVLVPQSQKTDSLQVTPEAMIDSILRNLDLSPITSGILADKAFPLIDPKLYTGAISDTTKVKYSDFMRLHAVMQSGSLSDNLSPSLPLPDASYHELTSLACKDPNKPFPLLIMHVNYHSLKPTALSEGLLSQQGIQLYDVQGRTASPYLSQTLFAASVASVFAPGPLVRIVPRTEWFSSNTGLTLPQLQIDMGDGLGYRSAQWGQNLEATYETSGVKEIKVQATYLNGTVLISHSLLKILKGAGERWNDNPGIQPNHTEYIPAIRPYPANDNHNGYGACILQIGYGCGQTQLRKPFIVVEGLDPSADDHDPTNRFDYIRFVLRMPDDIREQLEQNNYDLVFVNFTIGDDYIQRNAFALEQAIKWINNNKVGTEPNVVMGISMGGIVARYALRDLEVQGYDHQTNLFISFDSPHQGANAPLSTQYLTSHMANQRLNHTTGPLMDYVPELREVYLNLKAPASKQLLIFHEESFPAVHPLRQTLIAELNALGNNGYPLNCRRVAIANGSRTGIGQGFGPNALLAEVTGGNRMFFLGVDFNSFWATTSSIGSYILGTSVNVKVILNGLPEPNQGLRRVYKNRVLATMLYAPIVWWDVKVEVGGTPPLETAPGGTQRIAANVPDEFEEFVNAPVDAFCFMPSISSLDIPGHGGNYFFNIENNSNTIFTPTGRFSAFSAPPYPNIPDNNEIHTRFSRDVTTIFDGNANFINQHLVVERSIDVLANNINLSQTYNFGRNTSSGLSTTLNPSSIVVESGGQILVNKKVAIGLHPSSHPVSDVRNIELYVNSNCIDNRTIRIQTGGIFDIGDNTTQTGTVRFGANSTLHLNGGSLRIRNGSKLIIEAGANFIVTGNPEILLDGPDAILELRGSFDMRGATFAPTGSGFVRFGLPAVYTTDYVGNIQIDDNSKLILEGSQSNQKIAEILDNTFLLPLEWHNSQMTFKNGIVRMGKKAWIQTGNSKVNFIGVSFAGSTTKADYFDFIKLNGKPSVVDNCKFTGCNECLITLPGDYRTVISNSAFSKYSSSAILAIEDGITINNCTFTGEAINGNSTASEAVRIEAGIQPTYINNSTISNNLYGVHQFGTGGSALYLNNSTILNNAKGVQFAGLGMFRGTCGIISSNLGGVSIVNGRIDLSGKAYMSIVNNTYTYYNNAYASNIHLASAEMISLKGGYNNILTVSPIFPDGRSGISGTIRTNVTSISSFNNYWNLLGTAPRNYSSNPSSYDVDVSYYEDGIQGHPVNLIDISPTTANQCGNVDPCMIPVRAGTLVDCNRIIPVENCLTCEIIHTTNFPNEPLNVAVKKAISYSPEYDQQGTYAKAVQLLNEILMYPLVSTSAEEQAVLDHAYKMIKEMYANTLNDPTVNQSKDYVLQVIAKRLQDLTSSAGIEPKFYLNLDAALTSFSAGDLTGSKAKLNIAQSFSSNQNQSLYLYWECYIDAKKDLVDSLINDTQFLARIKTCNTTINTIRASQENIGDAKDLKNEDSKLVLIPNPAISAVKLEISSTEDDDVTVSLYDVRGARINKPIQATIKAGDTMIDLSLNGIAEGIYTVRVCGNKTNLVRKLVISK